MPPRPCLDCGRLSKASRCPTCHAERQRKVEAQRTRGPRPWYGAAFQAARKAALLNTPYCMRCGTTEDLTGDHVTPRSLDNGVEVLCRICNAKKGGGAKKSKAQGA